jgi:integrase
MWLAIAEEVDMLKERRDVGRAFSEDERHRILTAAKASSSRSLYPAILLSMHTGLRHSELRLLRWRQIDLVERIPQVGKSKTAAGEGRIIPLRETATQCLLEWRSKFPDAQPQHAVFPRESYALIGKKGTWRDRRALSNASGPANGIAEDSLAARQGHCEGRMQVA